MATPTYELLDSTTLASAASSVTFTSIDQSYGDLVLVVEGIADTSTAFLRPQFNGDTGSNYSRVDMEGNGSTTNSSSATGQTSGVIGALRADTRGLAIAQIMDYSATDKHKTFLSRMSAVNESVRALANRWADTSAISSITVLFTSDLATGTTLSLYGIAK